MLQNIKGVIFDLDGTLVSSSLDFSSIRKEIGCPANNDILSFVDEITCADDRNEANRVIETTELDDAVSADWLDGANDLLQYLSEKQIKLAIVTRNSHEPCNIKLGEYRTMFDIVYTRDDFPPKPAPDALLNIASHWAHGVDELIYVGDFIYDVLAAENAGMKSCLVSEKVYENIEPDIHIRTLPELKDLFAEIW